MPRWWNWYTRNVEVVVIAGSSPVLGTMINNFMSKWFDYVRSCYDLVIETEGKVNIVLEHNVEAYLVHLMANNFERTDIGEKIISIELMQAMQTGRREQYKDVGDECLLIHSYPLRRGRWPSQTYYQDMGMIAYGYANHMMEEHFIPASKVLTAVFNQR